MLPVVGANATSPKGHTPGDDQWHGQPVTVRSDYRGTGTSYAESFRSATAIGAPRGCVTVAVARGQLQTLITSSLATTMTWGIFSPCVAGITSGRQRPRAPQHAGQVAANRSDDVQLRSTQGCTRRGKAKASRQLHL